MEFIGATVQTLCFNHDIRAHEGRVKLVTSSGAEEFTARAYMPYQAPAAMVHDAFIRIARRKFRIMARMQGPRGQRETA